MFACATRRFPLITLLSSQAACEAAYGAFVSQMSKRGIIHAEYQERHLPDRERRCILAAAAFAALVAALVAAFVVPTIFEDCLPAEDGAEEEDMDSSCTWAQCDGL